LNKHWGELSEVTFFLTSGQSDPRSLPTGDASIVTNWGPGFNAGHLWCMWKVWSELPPMILDLLDPQKFQAGHVIQMLKPGTLQQHECMWQNAGMQCQSY
jgi:hypothetical protein